MIHIPTRRSPAISMLVAWSAALVLVFAWGCQSSSGPGEDPLPAIPTVSGIDKTDLAPGDTVTVTGADFHATTSYNRVNFNNPLADATPFEGTTTMLRVVVHENAIDGPVSVKVPNQPEAGVGPEVTVTRGVGDVWVYGGSGSVELPTPAGAQYLVIPYAGSASAPVTQAQPYTVSAAGVLPSFVASPFDAHDGTRGESPAAVSGSTIREAFESHRWNEAADLVSHVGVPPRPEARAAALGPVEIAQFRQFHVLNTTTGSILSPSSYSTVNAELRYTGQKCLIYTDVDTLATGNLTWSHIKTFGERFDGDLYPSNAKYFGTESDVDANGKVIILVTPVVNRMTPPNSSSFIGGFFLSVDLFAVGGGIPSGTTNHAEIFYVLSADPNATWGNTFTTAFVASENVKTIVHEDEHLISYSHRLFSQGGAAQTTWLEEGMAHMAEDLLAVETGDGAFNGSNVNRANRYLNNPAAVSLEYDASTIEQRGGIYLLLRLLGDRFGSGIYKQILQDDCVGRACVQGVTGEDFYALVGEFLAALYLSGRGITAADAYNYDTIDLANFAPVLVRTRAIDGAGNNGAVPRASGDLYRFATPVLGTSRFTFFTSSSTMGLRTVVVRLQ